MKADDIRKLTDEELAARIRELRRGQFDTSVKHATGQLEDTASLRKNKRDLARALTVHSERERAS